MTDAADEKLKNDLMVFERFATETQNYLNSDTLFWPMGNLPKLTLGGLLLRQHRLLLLRDQLDAAQQDRLDNAVGQFQLAISDAIVRFETKAHQELAARFRQWSQYLTDVVTGDAGVFNYAVAVEPRVMLALLLNQLQMKPYELNSDIPARLDALDLSLRARWKRGGFVWPHAWRAAYPQKEFWYLHGEIVRRSDN